MDVGIAFNFRPGEQVLLHPPGQLESRRVQAPWRHGAEIHHLGARLARSVHQGEADTAQAGVPGLHRRQGECRRHRRIDRVAAGIQRCNARLRSTLRLRDDDAAPPGGGGFGELPVLGDVGRWGEVHRAGSVRRVRRHARMRRRGWQPWRGRNAELSILVVTGMESRPPTVPFPRPPPARGYRSPTSAERLASIQPCTMASRRLRPRAMVLGPGGRYPLEV